jgi:hypothetical protein
VASGEKARRKHELPRLPRFSTQQSRQHAFHASVWLFLYVWFLPLFYSISGVEVASFLLAKEEYFGDKLK